MFNIATVSMLMLTFSLALITIVHCPEFLHFPKPFLINSHGFLQKWDPNLKLVAEGYAAKCIWNHNPDLEDTGENLFAGTGSLDPREAMEKWFLGESGSSEACSLAGHRSWILRGTQTPLHQKSHVAL